jgi:large subunit ribosomal protein L25
MIEIDQAGKRQTVIPRAVQFDPVTDEPLHIDLYRVDENTRIDVEVVVHFVNSEDSPGLKRGGVLNIVRHTVEVNCLAKAIPEELVADLTGLGIGDAVHISNIPLPQGVRPTIRDRDFTIATITGRMADMVEIEAPEAAPAEGEAEAESE